MSATFNRYNEGDKGSRIGESTTIILPDAVAEIDPTEGLWITWMGQLLVLQSRDLAWQRMLEVWRVEWLGVSVGAWFCKYFGWYQISRWEIANLFLGMEDIWTCRLSSLHSRIRPYMHFYSKVFLFGFVGHCIEGLGIQGGWLCTIHGAIDIDRQRNSNFS